MGANGLIHAQMEIKITESELLLLTQQSK